MKEYEKYIVQQDEYLRRYGNMYVHDFPEHAMKTSRNTYKEDTSNHFETFTPKLEKMIEKFFEDNPRCQYCVVKDTRCFYENLVMRKIMELKYELDDCRVSQFKITDAIEASKSSCVVCFRENKPLQAKQTERFLDDLFQVLREEGFKAKEIKVNLRNHKDCHGDYSGKKEVFVQLLIYRR